MRWRNAVGAQTESLPIDVLEGNDNGHGFAVLCDDDGFLVHVESIVRQGLGGSLSRRYPSPHG